MEDTPKVVTGNFSTRTYHVDVLFNSGATHSFISSRLVETLWLAPTIRQSLLSIAHPDGKVVNCPDLYIDYPIQIHGHDFLANLYKFELTKFDIISKHQAHIDCLKHKVTLTGLKGERIVHRGKPLEDGVRLISAGKAH